MGLKCTFKDAKTKANLTDGFIHVDNFYVKHALGPDDVGFAQFVIHVWPSKADALSGIPPLSMYNIRFESDSDAYASLMGEVCMNTVARTYLKTLDGTQGTEDNGVKIKPESSSLTGIDLTEAIEV